MVEAGSILIVDDELNLRSSLSHIFQRVGYQVKTAGGAREAIHHLVAQCFDLIFLDLKMPGIGGIELLAEIRLIDPGVPVIILTACANLDIAYQTLGKGTSAYLVKPIDPALIISRANEVIKEDRRNKLQVNTRLLGNPGELPG
jgi:DNA-binding NtrC family response regulator